MASTGGPAVIARPASASNRWVVPGWGDAVAAGARERAMTCLTNLFNIN
jgi:hypothetical protein